MQDTCFSNWATGALCGLYLTLDQFAILQGVIVWSRAATVSCAAAFIRLLLCAHKYCYLCHMWCVRATLTSIFPLSWWCLVAQRLPEQSTCVGAHRDWKSLYLKYWICCFIITTSPSLQSTCTCCSQLYQFVFLLYLEAVECFPCIKTWLKHYFAKSPPRIKNACRGENVHFQNILYFTNFRFMQTDA